MQDGKILSWTELKEELIQPATPDYFSSLKHVRQNTIGVTL